MPSVVLVPMCLQFVLGVTTCIYRNSFDQAGVAICKIIKICFGCFVFVFVSRGWDTFLGLYVVKDYQIIFA